MADVWIPDSAKPAYFCWIGVRLPPGNGIAATDDSTSQGAVKKANWLNWHVGGLSPAKNEFVSSLTDSIENKKDIFEMEGVIQIQNWHVNGLSLVLSKDGSSATGFIGDTNFSGTPSARSVLDYSPSSFATRDEALHWLAETDEGRSWSYQLENCALLSFASAVRVEPKIGAANEVTNEEG